MKSWVKVLFTTVLFISLFSFGCGGGGGGSNDPQNPPEDTNADLGTIVISSGSLVFDPDVITYSVEVDNSVASFTLTPTLANTLASVTVNGTGVESGKPFGPVNLEVGPNTFQIIITAADGTTTKTYTIVVTRLPIVEKSHNADLSGLVLSQGALSPAYNANNLNYTAEVANNVTYLTVTPTAAGVNASITVKGSAVTSGTASASIPLSVGDNPIPIVVTAEDGTTVKTYSVTVKRLDKPSTDDNLSNLTISLGTLNPSFNPSTISYSAEVPNAIASLTVTPTAAGANASIKVKNVAVTSGNPSQAISLNIGLNTVTIVVTAEDGAHTKTYTLLVMRLDVDTAAPSITSCSPTNGAALTSAPSSLTVTFSENIVFMPSMLKVSGLNVEDSRKTCTGKILTVNLSGLTMTPGMYSFTFTGIQDAAGNTMSSMTISFSLNGSTSKWAKITTGATHTIAIKNNGSIWAWGDNGSGRLGDGSNTNILIPKQIGTDLVWAFVSAGYKHNIGIKSDGSLWAWGDNMYGQLGDGTNVDKTVHTRIGTDTDWAVVAAGYSHSVAIKTNGSLWAWGDNGNGQLGDGTNTDKNTPTRIGTETDWAVVVGGGSYTMAIKTNGSLWGWGENGGGEVGDGTNTDKNTPTRIGIDTDWALVSAGLCHSVAIKTNSSLWAWGSNIEATLGDGTIIDKNLPIKIGTGWALAATGQNHTIAIKTDGSLWAWGTNNLGQLGDGTTTIKLTPTPIGIDTNWIFITSKLWHNVAIKADGSLWSWGFNNQGQLGDGTTTDKHVPTHIGTDTDW